MPDNDLFFSSVPLSHLQPSLDAIGFPQHCGVRSCRRSRCCLAINPVTGEPACLARTPTDVWIHRYIAQTEADLWLVDGVIAGLLQPFGEWPEDTIGPRLIACYSLSAIMPVGPEMQHFFRWWKTCRQAAIEGGWLQPRRPATPPPGQPPVAPKQPRKPDAVAPMQPPEMAQPAAGGPQNGSQTLDL